MSDPQTSTADFLPGAPATAANAFGQPTTATVAGPGTFDPASASAPSPTVSFHATPNSAPSPSSFMQNGSDQRPAIMQVGPPGMDEERKMEMIRGMEPAKLQNIRKVSLARSD
jgi:hypothetical protein